MSNSFQPLALGPSAGEGRTVDVDLELILAVDVSDSMNIGERRLQREGYVGAFRHPDIAAAVALGEIGSIAVLYLEWAGPGSQHVLVPWTILTTPQDAASFARALGELPIATASPTGNGAMYFGELLDTPPIATASATSISASLLLAREMFHDAGLRTHRQVIDISGDGVNNAGPSVTQVRDLLVSEGIVINGLPITLSARDTADSFLSFGRPFLERYFENCVVGGWGSFVIAVADMSRFERAIRRKLVSEIAGEPVAVRQASAIPTNQTQIDCADARP